MNRLESILLDLSGQASNLFISLTKNVALILGILIVMKVALTIINKAIDRFFEKKKIGKFSMEERRANTLSTISKSIIMYLVYFLGFMTIAGLFVDVTSILAVAGIGSVAIGFGAQSLVKDIVTGFFIFFEDQFSVGDYITSGGFDGIVEIMSLRTTHIRSFAGDLHIIPNGEISHVTNHSRGNMRAMIDIRVSYEDDMQRILNILTNLCKKIAHENESIIEGPYVLGVQELTDSSVNIRITAQTVNMEQWGVERILRQQIQETFRKEGIEIPYPRRVISGETIKT